MVLDLNILEFDIDFKILKNNPLVILKDDTVGLYDDILLYQQEIINMHLVNFAIQNNIIFDSLIEGDFRNLSGQGKVALLLSNTLYVLYDMNNSENIGMKRDLIINEILK